MQKLNLREENSKLQAKLKSMKAKYRKLQGEVDEEIANKLSLTITKLGLLFTAGVAIGKLLK